MPVIPHPRHPEWDALGIGCRINCSGGCPHCAPDEHHPTCVQMWENGGDKCICDVIRGVLASKGEAAKMRQEELRAPLEW